MYIDLYIHAIAQKKCYFSTAGAMDMPVSKLFVDAYFPEASRDAALEMLAQIRDQFNSSLSRKAWMDSVTREKVLSLLTLPVQKYTY